MNGQEQPTHRSMPKPTWAGICRLLYSWPPSAATVMFPSVHIWLLGLSQILGGEIGLLWVSYHLLLNRWNSEEDRLRHGYSVKHWRGKCSVGRNTWGSPVQTSGQQGPGFRCLYQQPREVMKNESCWGHTGQAAGRPIRRPSPCIATSRWDWVNVHLDKAHSALKQRIVCYD